MSLIKNIEPVVYHPNPDFELHVLVCKRDIWMLIWSLKSFLFFSDLTPQIIIHDDGSLDLDSIQIIRNIFPQTSVLVRKEAEQKLQTLPEYKGIIKKYRQSAHVMTLKLVDVIFLSSAKYVMTLDTDILFFTKPRLIVDFVNGRLPYQSMISGVHKGSFEIAVDDLYLKKYNLDRNKLSLMCAGLVIFRKDALKYDRLVEFFENVKLPPEDYFVEMTAWCCLIGQMNYVLLPPDQYIMKGKIRSKTVMKHFTSPRRHEMFAYGIDEARKRIRQEGR